MKVFQVLKERHSDLDCCINHIKIPFGHDGMCWHFGILEDKTQKRANMDYTPPDSPTFPLLLPPSVHPSPGPPPVLLCPSSLISVAVSTCPATSLSQHCLVSFFLPLLYSCCWLVGLVNWPSPYLCHVA